MSLTGGELNELNGKYGISAPNNSVPVMKLIREHKPTTKDELYELIKYHHGNKCSCGIVSKGSIEDFGKNLFDAQISEWGKPKFTLQECVQWEYHLFVTNSIKGSRIELSVRDVLAEQLKEYEFVEADGFVDEELRIDLIIKKESIEVGGIQIKPETYKFMRSSVKHRNTTSNAKWGHPVLYLYYDINEKLIDIEKIVGEIKGLK